MVIYRSLHAFVRLHDTLLNSTFFGKYHPRMSSPYTLLSAYSQFRADVTGGLSCSDPHTDDIVRIAGSIGVVVWRVHRYSLFLSESYRRVRREFDNAVISLPPPASDNELFSAEDEVSVGDWVTLQARAEEAQVRMNVRAWSLYFTETVARLRKSLMVCVATAMVNLGITDDNYQQPGTDMEVLWDAVKDSEVFISNQLVDIRDYRGKTLPKILVQNGVCRSSVRQRLRYS